MIKGNKIQTATATILNERTNVSMINQEHNWNRLVVRRTTPPARSFDYNLIYTTKILWYERMNILFIISILIYISQRIKIICEQSNFHYKKCSNSSISCFCYTSYWYENIDMNYVMCMMRLVCCLYTTNCIYYRVLLYHKITWTFWTGILGTVVHLYLSSLSFQSNSSHIHFVRYLKY